MCLHTWPGQCAVHLHIASNGQGTPVDPGARESHRAGRTGAMGHIAASALQIHNIKKKPIKTNKKIKIAIQSESVPSFYKFNCSIMQAKAISLQDKTTILGQVIAQVKI